jgi:hypothetical protein
VVLGSGSYGKVRTIYSSPEKGLGLLILKIFIQVYKGSCRNTGKHLAVKVVLDLTQKVK